MQSSGKFSEWIYILSARSGNKTNLQKYIAQSFPYALEGLKKTLISEDISSYFLYNNKI